MCALRGDEHVVRFAPAALLALLLQLVAGCGGGAPPPAASTRPQGSATPATGAASERNAPAPRTAETRDAVVGRLDGRRIAVEGRVVRLDRTTLVCGGVGRPAGRRHAAPAWTRFRCVQPTFPPGAVAGPDAILFVEPRAGRRLVLTGARFADY